MLIHNVYFWLKKGLSAEDRATFESELKRLSQSSRVDHGLIGAAAPTEDRSVTDHSFDYATSFHFKTLTDHDFYQKECPAHARFVSKCKALWDRVIVYDFTPLS